MTLIISGGKSGRGLEFPTLIPEPVSLAMRVYGSMLNLNYLSHIT